MKWLRPDCDSLPENAPILPLRADFSAIRLRFVYARPVPKKHNPHVVRRLIHGNVRFIADLGIIAGKRVQKTFKTRELADLYLVESKGKLKSHGHTALAFSEDERILFQGVRDRLARIGATIDQAERYFVENHKPVKEVITLRELARRCELAKAVAAGPDRDRYVKQLRSSMKSFYLGREDRPASEITKAEVAAWIRGNGFAPKTQRVYLGDVRTMFGWGVDEGFLRTNPVEGEKGFIELEKLTEGEITCLDIAQCKALLKVGLLGSRRLPDRKGEPGPQLEKFGHRQVLGYLVLAMFCGVRPEELARTSVKELDLRERTVIIMGRSSKTRQRRVIELPAVAVAWLRLWRLMCPKESELVGTNFRRRWEALRTDAKILNWPHDVLRHTCASMTYAAEQNMAKVQAILGHSEDEDTLFRHYRAVRTLGGKTVSRKMGEEFLALTPRKVRLSR